jgi:hypothetical protein
VAHKFLTSATANLQPHRDSSPAGPVIRAAGRGARKTMPVLNEERIKGIVMAEAYRTIKVHDGPRQVSIPKAQAIIRSLAVNAIKGQHRAQRLYSELLCVTERDNILNKI